MLGRKFLERSIIMLFKIIYFISLLFIFSAGKFYQVGCLVNVIRIAFNNTIQTSVKKIQEVFVNVVNIRFKAAAIIYFLHNGKTVIQVF